MTFRSGFMLVAILLGLLGCSSVSTHYYTLLPAATGNSPKNGEAAPFQLEILPVRVPVQVDQPQMVIRQNNGRLAILDNDRWSSALADEFQSALSDRLEQQLGIRNLSGLPRDPDKPVMSLRADVRRFESVPGYYALVDMVWNLTLSTSGEKRRSLNCSSVVRETAGIELNSLVLAHQRAIESLAQSIAVTARAWARNPAAGCP
ncbi:PqiC family protein [Azomonas macrocytogenes]|uniref:ABC-type transport auxiliary lipoprotein component domain-containing protein n=1 Tax=Azomonas macrocytogenes TaxID=69962 RepID=A0A839SXX6_AZOMA|nr:PqiC family protein [Azomonas macrocytogenes]MBB3101768.1 hypothetical protein [Azomonas macrocytogenes]